MSRYPVICPTSADEAALNFRCAREYRRLAASDPSRRAECERWADAWQQDGTRAWMRSIGRPVVTQVRA